MPFRRCLILLPLVVFASASAAQTLGYRDTKLSPQQRAHDLVGRMSLEEKASQLEDWAPAIPRLGVPDYQTWSEALHAFARAGYATVFPQAIGMAATWDTSIVHTMGGIIADEARAKFNQAQREDNHRIFYGLTFWSPNVNIFRDPRWGRGQETYGEDPFLTGRMGVAFVQGVQGPDPAHPIAIATPKHFAVHSGPEPLRHGFDVEPSPYDLEDTYLPAFRATVTEGHAGSVMCAYNAIDGDPACANKMLLQDHLRDAWGFKGFVVSDCGAIADIFQGHKKVADIEHAATLSLQAGTDLSCSIWAPGFNALAGAVKQGLVSEDLVTQSAERLFTARIALGLFDPKGSNKLAAIPFSDVASAPHRAASLKAAEESIVLLKNSGVLPLKPASKIAVIGPTADLLPSILGNYEGTPFHPVTPLDGMMAAFKNTSLLYAQGSTLAEGAAVPVPRTAFGPGLKTEFFASADWSGQPAAVTTQKLIQADWENAEPHPAIHSHDYAVRWSGTLAMPAAGHYVLSVAPNDSFPYSPVEKYRLLLDGKLLSEGSLRRDATASAAPGAPPTMPPPMSRPLTPQIAIDATDSRPHDFVLEYSHAGDRAGGGVTLQWIAPAQAQIDEAVARAKEADVVVAFVGLSPNLEGEEMDIKIPGFEGGDRTALDLPAAQENLLEALAAAGKPLVVVLQSGSAVALNWANAHADAVLAAWYPGAEGGTAIARTLVGQNNPAGRLPVTFYASLDGIPPFTDYGMKDRTYRYFQGKPLWGFGYGLSYTNFKYGALKLSAQTLKAGSPLTATVAVTNTGKMGGDEVVQAYLKTPMADGPRHALVAFQRVAIAPGATKKVTLKIDPRALSSVDANGNRAIIPGLYGLSVGGAQPEEAVSKAETAFAIAGTKALPK